MALAPSFPLFGVPSSLIRKSSISFCLVTSKPASMRAGAMISLTLATALLTPLNEKRQPRKEALKNYMPYLFRRRRSCHHHGVRRLREYQSKRQRAPRHGSGLLRVLEEGRLNFGNFLTFGGVDVDLNGGVTARIEDLSKVSSATGSTE